MSAATWTGFAAAPRSDVSLLRLYLLRASYLLIVVGLGSEVWPVILDHSNAWGASHGVTFALLGGIAALAVIGLRYPLRMLPLLLFEPVWKSLWLLAFAAPLWAANRMDEGQWENVFACLMGVVIFPLTIPWSYVIANYLRTPGERWR